MLLLLFIIVYICLLNCLEGFIFVFKVDIFVLNVFSLDLLTLFGNEYKNFINVKFDEDFVLIFFIL